MLFNKNNCCDRQMGYGMPMQENMGCPIVEPAINKCVEREFCHNVEQDCFFMIEKRNSLYKNILFFMKLIY